MKRIIIICLLLATAALADPNLLLIDETAPGSDQALAQKVADKFSDDFQEPTDLTGIDTDDLDERATVFIYHEDALVIVGKHAENAKVLLATKVSGFLRDQGSIVTNRISDEIRSSDLRDYVDHGCTDVGEYISGSAGKDYYVPCCDGLKGFDTGSGKLCYDPAKGKPVCRLQGSKSEGWYYDSTGGRINYAQCQTREVSVSVTTDKTHYEIGEEIEVTVAGGAEVELTVTDPSGARYPLNEGACTESSRQVCYYDIEARMPGTYIIKATSRTETATTKVSVRGNPGIGDRFTLDSGETVTIDGVKITREMCLCPGYGECDCPEVSLRLEDDGQEEMIGLDVGETGTAFGLAITLEKMGELPVFYVTRADMAELTIKPQLQTTGEGETVNYQVTLKDMHPDCVGCEPIEYRLDVDGLPFRTSLEDTVGIMPGQSITLQLQIFTDDSGEYSFTVKAESDDSSDTAQAKLSVIPSVDPTYTLGLDKGWNLVSLPGELERFESPGFKLQGFVFIKEEQKYYTLPQAEERLGSRFKSYLAENSFWIYSKQEADLKVHIGDKVSYTDLSLVKGWNMMPVTTDMVGKSMGDILGECDAERIDIYSQGWQSIMQSYVFRGTGGGFLVKSSQACSLGLTPPPMPGGEQ